MILFRNRLLFAHPACYLSVQTLVQPGIGEVTNTIIHSRTHTGIHSDAPPLYPCTSGERLVTDDLTKSVIVTGASRGIGRVVAKRLSRDGFAVRPPEAHALASWTGALQRTYQYPLYSLRCGPRHGHGRERPRRRDRAARAPALRAQTAALIRRRRTWMCPFVLARYLLVGRQFMAAGRVRPPARGAAQRAAVRERRGVLAQGHFAEALRNGFIE